MSQLPTIQNQVEAFRPEEIQILKQTIMPGATDPELALFGKVCAQTGLSPFARQIFPVSRMAWNQDSQREEKKWSFQTSVDGFRLIAQRSKEYEGQTQTLWCGTDGVWKDVWLSVEFPVAAKVGVFRKNFREPLYAIALWESYVQKYRDRKTGQDKVGTMWQKMPELMLAKCAECLALRRAFPQELSGIYSQEEMSQSASGVEDSGQENGAHQNAPEDAGGKQGETCPPASSKVFIGKKELNPDEFFTTILGNGKRISECDIGFLESWVEKAKYYFQESLENPAASQTDIARSYRSVVARMAELQPQFPSFSGSSNGVH